jgi:hypothetical protein
MRRTHQPVVFIQDCSRREHILNGSARPADFRPPPRQFGDIIDGFAAIGGTSTDLAAPCWPLMPPL